MTQATSRSVTFDFVREGGRVVDVRTSSPEINHFLRVIRQSRSRNTWLSYAQDLKLFFAIIGKPPALINRADCLTFMEWHDTKGLARATINRRLAAVSRMFNELIALDPDVFLRNPIDPSGRRRRPGRNTDSLYRKQPQRIPSVVAAQDIKDLLATLRTWRDRSIVMLMWMSCLRISEALDICFCDIECSRRSLHVRNGKGGLARTVFMDLMTFSTLNRYLDLERDGAFTNEQHVFVALKGKARGAPLSVNAFQKLLAYHADACGISNLHAHLFRHTGITQLIQHGMSEPAVRAFVGHRNPASLTPYLHLADSFVESEFANACDALGMPRWLNQINPGGEA